MIALREDRNKEWPIIRLWYTKHRGKTIEEVIDTALPFFEWMVNTFQNVTPAQADYYFKVTGHKLPDEVIQDVEPYEWLPGDPELTLYEEICNSQDLHGTLKKYRGEQLELF